MKPIPWPDWIDDLWAKSPDKGVGGEPESLAQHTWLVLNRLTDFIRLRANQKNQWDAPRLWHSLYWGAFLHDFGKAMPGFQGLLRGDKNARSFWSGHRHEVFSLGFLDWIVDGLDEVERLWVVAGIVSHHKDAEDIFQAYPLPEPGEPDDLLVEQMKSFSLQHYQGLHRWLNECGWTWAQVLGLDKFGVSAIGVTPSPSVFSPEQMAASIRGYLRSYKKFFRQLKEDRTPENLVPLLFLRGTLTNADHSASAHLERLPSVQISSKDVIEKRGIPRTQLYTHQQVAERFGGSVLLTAPTGSGKTEAALLWASNQKFSGRLASRLFYTLPYQASMNAMLLRLQEIFEVAERNLVGLQHGRALLALYRQLMDRDYGPEHAGEEARRLKDLARLNYPPIRVFSPYQMLKAVYRLKGYEAQLSDYKDALFIFDEIHAYETKRLALILKTMEYLHRYYDARFFVMSATFPSLIKSWLQNALELSPSDEIQATPELFQKFQRHRLDIIEGELLNPENIAKIIADARSGQSVLVVCNLVSSAQEAYNALRHLEQDGIRVELLHGRFNARDRRKKEKLVQDATGSRSQNRSPVVLVATQVVEVSLDIDLNTIYTEPAPLEALVQRFGRINRRRKMADLATVHVFTRPDDGQKIYNPRLIAGTLKILRREQGKPINENAIGRWLDEIYQGEIADEWQHEFNETAKEFEESVLDTLRPFQSNYGLRQEFYKAFDGVDVLPNDDWEEFDRIRHQNPLQARELFVSISYSRLCQLKSKRLAWEEEGGWPIVVEVPYTSELGLDFSQI